MSCKEITMALNLDNTRDIFYFAPGDTNALFTPNWDDLTSID